MQFEARASDAAVTIEYERRRRWRMRRVWVVLLLLITVAGSIGWKFSAIELWGSRAAMLYSARHPPERAGRVTVVDVADATLDPSGRLEAFADRVTPWCRTHGGADAALMQLEQYQGNIAGPGSVGHAYSGTLQAPEGKPRMIRVGFNISASAHRTFFTIDAVLYDGGTYFSARPQLNRLAPRLSTSSVNPANMVAHDAWVRFTVATLDRPAKLELDVGRVDPARPGVIRIPIWLDSQSDTLLLSLDKDDGLDLALESGAGLPVKLLSDSP